MSAPLTEERIAAFEDLAPAASPQTHDAIVDLAAEVRRLRECAERLTHERSALGRAIADAALRAGIYNGEVALSGPDLILLTQNMAEEIERLRSERDGYQMSTEEGTEMVGELRAEIDRLRAQIGGAS